MPRSPSKDKTSWVGRAREAMVSNPRLSPSRSSSYAHAWLLSARTTRHAGGAMGRRRHAAGRILNDKLYARLIVNVKNLIGQVT